jgi:hypothetical protein
MSSFADEMKLTFLSETPLILRSARRGDFGASSWMNGGAIPSNHPGKFAA